MRFSTRKSCLHVLAAATSILAISAPAHAQDATAQANEEEVASGEIIVTATRRAEALSDVPIAISAVNSASLQNSGANDIRQLNQLAPSLLVSSTGSEANGSARIRGIGTVGDNPGLESSVAVFIDGVYRSRSGVGLNELGEIERVEVLRGPQGTLFGRNASAGLIHVISKKPSFTFGGSGEVTYGNYDYLRLAAAMTGPISDTIAVRIDQVYSSRDGFYNDVINQRDVNDRNRYFVKGQVLFEPSDTTSLRLIGDYSQKKEQCCAAVYIDRAFNPTIGGLNDPAQNPIIRVLTDLGQPAAGFSNPFSRNIWVTPGRDYYGLTKDGGVSLEINQEFGAVKLTSITGYREYKNEQAGDVDYSAVDILYRSFDGGGGYARQFKTFTQELRLQGTTFNDRLDWLVGGFFSSERLNLSDNIKFGNQYGRFATCRIVAGSALAPFYSVTSPGCLTPTGRATVAGGFGAATLSAFDTLDSVNNRGSLGDKYSQLSRNFAVFTHNIFTITDGLKLTLGARYTWENKDFNASFANNNTACPAIQGATLAPALAPFLIGLACQGNSTSELNGVSITSKRKESEFTGTAVLSYKFTPDLMAYASYSRGYKAGGFNLDRSALKNPGVTFASVGGAQAVVGRLQFDPEINNAMEIGIKYGTRPFSVSLTAFRQDFENFQLNTFNGSVFLVQNVNGCETDLAGADRDASVATGACAADSVGWGVRSQGIELETSLNPTDNLAFNFGVTYAKTQYRDDLVANSAGAPLDPALRVIPGRQLSNAPIWVTTSSASWTPEIGNSGLSALFYVDSRLTDNFNTGSDLFPQKAQDTYIVVNARVGLRGPEQRWAVELWAQNLFDKEYSQVAFNTPFQAGPTSAPYVYPAFPGGRQLFSMFLSEPRTYGVTGRVKF
ncbi:outer membrane receptor protein involved in Fe transport [Novosphingobium kunmingense]|uniref:Outer membrane receptor protein involved in Fe transport n=1 Tax=Novosphingobium kunmingense TaxID=1211806 RepID=A0A2N0H4Y2_9SPHN|nr:TonB-dependent receptor [Novosphingobium kunmingense]PKB14011.1 outer membrane receptor protein involved in Fe transport [Novosphingobium kunmingense]